MLSLTLTLTILHLLTLTLRLTVRLTNYQLTISLIYFSYFSYLYVIHFAMWLIGELEDFYTAYSLHLTT